MVLKLGCLLDMSSFLYIAHDLAGEEKKGLKRGVSEQEVYRWLHEQSLIPVEVRPADTSVKSKTKSKSFGRARPKYSDISAFCWQLSTMLEGGVTITEALDTISEDIDNPSFRYTLMDLSEQIKRGESLSGSIASFPKVFNKLFCAMILAGETSGSLPTILTRLAEFYEKRDQFIKKIRAALTYPIFVVFFVIVILVVMMTLIIPKFRLIFDQMGGELPAFTQAFMNVYDVLAGNMLLVLSFVSLITVFIVAFAKTRQGYIAICSFMLSVPILGRLASQAFVTTFCRTMSTLLAAGVSIVEAFDIISEMTSNDVIRTAVVRSRDNIIEGSSISAGLASTGFFPNMVAKMVEVGERSGSLPKVLNKASNYYETKMDATITTMLNLLGPMVIVVVGGIVLVVVVALYLPIFSMSEVKMH